MILSLLPTYVFIRYDAKIHKKLKLLIAMRRHNEAGGVLSFILRILKLSSTIYIINNANGRDMFIKRFIDKDIVAIKKRSTEYHK